MKWEDNNGSEIIQSESTNIIMHDIRRRDSRVSIDRHASIVNTLKLIKRNNKILRIRVGVVIVTFVVMSNENRVCLSIEFDQV